MVGVNIVFSLACVPIGKLSDHMPAERLLALGLVFLALSDVVFAVWATPVGASLGAALWGLHLGATQGVFSKMTADAAPERQAGNGFWAFQLRERSGCACCRTRCRHDLGVCRPVSHFLAGLGLCCRGFRLAAFGASPPSGLCEILSLMLQTRKPITT